jgi:hypothetical protein
MPRVDNRMAGGIARLDAQQLGAPIGDVRSADAEAEPGVAQSAAARSAASSGRYSCSTGSRARRCVADARQGSINPSSATFLRWRSARASRAVLRTGPMKRSRALGLDLIIVAIVYWNSTYMQRRPLLAHVAPLKRRPDLRSKPAARRRQRMPTLTDLQGAWVHASSGTSTNSVDRSLMCRTNRLRRP